MFNTLMDFGGSVFKHVPGAMASTLKQLSTARTYPMPLIGFITSQHLSISLLKLTPLGYPDPSLLILFLLSFM